MIRPSIRGASLIARKAAKPKLRHCANKGCRATFVKWSMTQVVCSVTCSIVVAEEKRKKAERIAAKIERQSDKARKEALKKRSTWLAEAQTAFNAFIRARDHLDAWPCISCGRDNDCKINAGHYLSVGAHPELRFNEDNCHKQCEHCNTHKSGNQAEYRPRLIERIGVDRVALLEGPHEPTKYTIEQIKEIKALYKAKLKELLRLQANEGVA